jgi:hypothetical protein
MVQGKRGILRCLRAGLFVQVFCDLPLHNEKKITISPEMNEDSIVLSTLGNEKNKIPSLFDCSIRHK